MKTNSILYGIAFATLALAETPRDKFKAICPGKDDQPGSYDSGSYKVHYTCNKSGITPLNDPEVVADPEACALLCRTHAECKGSAWLYGEAKCQMFSEGDVASVPVKGAVYMRRDTPAEATTPEPEVSGDGDCINSLQNCQAEKDELGDELDACKSARAACEAELATCVDADDLEACREEVDMCKASSAAEKLKLHKDLETCRASAAKSKEDPVWVRRRGAMQVCGYGGRSKIAAGRYSYAAHCGRRATTGSFYRQAALGVDACLSECTKDPRCKSVNYNIMDDAHCKFYDTGSTGPVEVMGESECPKGFVIGFTPTTPK